VVASSMPGVSISSFVLTPEDLKSIATDPAELYRAIDPKGEVRLMVMLADPYSVPMDTLLHAFNISFEGVPMVGGMSSGAEGPGQCALIIDGRVHRLGAVGVALSGELQADVIVSQGCRPVGPLLSVTDAEWNVIQRLEGKSPILRIQQLLNELPESDQYLVRNGLFVGRAIDLDKQILGRGDFLIRGIVGVDQESGAIAIGDVVQPGEKIQFHLRDANTAVEDLEMMLSPHTLFGAPCGAIMFSCNGRGTRLYDHPSGDVSTVKSFFEDLPLAGFFCAGEIGPIGGKVFLHGHTVSLALIRPRS